MPTTTRPTTPDTTGPDVPYVSPLRAVPYEVPEPAPAEVPVAAHARHVPGRGAQRPPTRVEEIEGELLRLNLAIVQGGGHVSEGIVTAAREYVTGYLNAVVEGSRKLPRELADHLAQRLTSPDGPPAG